MTKRRFFSRRITYSPTLFRTINGWLTVLWVVMIPVSVNFGWIKSVEYVSALSIYALVTGHLSTWQASRVEVKQEEQEQADVYPPSDKR